MDMARKLYKVSFTGFSLVYADSAKEAAETAEDGSEITYSEVRRDVKLMEDGCTVDDNGFCVFFDGEEYE
jgi:hypothetical protein